MLGTVSLAPRSIDEFVPIVGAPAIDALRTAARPLHGLKLANLTVSAFGTWHTDLLSCSVPLLRDLGIDATWGIVRPAATFEPAIAALYTALAGGAVTWSRELHLRWDEFTRSVRPLLEGADITVVHDPQLLGLAPERGGNHSRRDAWVWHSHLDLSGTDHAAWMELRNAAERFDQLLFEDVDFLPPGLSPARATIVPPGLDPLGPRNVPMDAATAAMLAAGFGIDASRPVIAQVAPLNAGSDALGLIEAFDLLHRRFPMLQLAIVPTAIREDVESRAYLETVATLAQSREGCVLVPVPGNVGNAERNAVQQVAEVVVQKSLGRGYALWLSEAMWKERPVVAGRSTGTVAQVVDGVTGYLVADTHACVDRIAELLEDQALRQRLGAGGRKHVQERFLVTRYLADVLHSLANLVATGRSV